MKLGLAWRLAKREMRGGLRSFRVFLACLAIGVGAIAAVGSVTEAITAGLQSNGQRLLGGDVELRLTHRFASAEERRFLDANSAAVSEIVSFRGMVGAPDGERALAQVKAVDDAYPLVGTLDVSGGTDVEETLREKNGVHGALAEQALIDRLDLSIGDTLQLGTSRIELRGFVLSEPDRQASGLQLGPRLLLKREALEGTGLLQPGSLYRTEYRLLLPEAVSTARFRDRLDSEFPDAGWRWRDLGNPSPGVSGTVERIGTFLILVGLASLAVGGVGVFAATRGYLERKTETIGTLKALGAEGGLIVTTYLLQIGVLGLFGILIGLLIGAGAPLLLAPQLADALPVPAAFGVYPGVLAEAALYGALTVVLFALWPLAQARETPSTILFRDSVDRRRALPRPGYLVVLAVAAVVLVGAAIWFAGSLFLGGAFMAGLAVALVFFAAAALLVRWFARWLGQRRGLTANRPAFRLALAAVGGPGGETAGVMLSLGLGLTLLSTIGQIDSNLRGLVDRDISDEAPAFFFIDIPAPQRDAFAQQAGELPPVSRVDTAPMLRGRITHINGERASAENVPPEARWMLEGDRGLTYSETPPDGSTLTEGTWWSAAYTGEPLVSFIDEEGRQMGLEIGDTITVNVLGRDLTARIASFRDVEWRRMGINFTMVFNPSALRAAPHSHIATVYAEEGSEGRVTRDLAADFPSAVAIPVREVISQTSALLGDLANGVRGASVATLLSGLIVLIGATAAGQQRMIYDSAVLKTLGATRGALLRAFTLRFLLLGLVAAGLAVALGTAAAWAVVRFVFEARFEVDVTTGAVIALLGTAATLGSGALFAWRVLSARPAEVLRSRA